MGLLFLNLGYFLFQHLVPLSFSNTPYHHLSLFLSLSFSPTHPRVCSLVSLFIFRNSLPLLPPSHSPRYKLATNIIFLPLSHFSFWYFVSLFIFLLKISVTRLCDLLDFGPLLKAFGKHQFAQIFCILRQFL